MTSPSLSASEHPLSDSMDLPLPLSIFESPNGHRDIPFQGHSTSKESSKKSTAESSSERKSSRCTCEYCVSQSKREGPPKTCTSAFESLNLHSKSTNKKEQKKSSKSSNWERPRSFSMVLVPDPDVSVLNKEQKEQEDVLHRRSVVESLLPPKGSQCELQDFYLRELPHSQLSDDGGSTETGNSSSNNSSPATAALYPTDNNSSNNSSPATAALYPTGYSSNTSSPVTTSVYPPGYSSNTSSPAMTTVAPRFLSTILGGASSDSEDENPSDLRGVFASHRTRTPRNHAVEFDVKQNQGTIDSESGYRPSGPWNVYSSIKQKRESKSMPKPMPKPKPSSWAVSQAKIHAKAKPKFL